MGTWGRLVGVAKKATLFSHIPASFISKKTKTGTRGQGPIVFPANSDYSILLFFAPSAVFSEIRPPDLLRVGPSVIFTEIAPSDLLRFRYRPFKMKSAHMIYYLLRLNRFQRNRVV